MGALAQALALLVLLIGAAMLLARLLGLSGLISRMPRGAIMQPDDAVAFCLAGLGIALSLRSGAIRVTGQLLLGAVALCGAAHLARELFGLDVGLDRLWSQDGGAGANAEPLVPMSAFAALAFLLLGAGALLQRRPKAWSIGTGQSLVVLAALLALHSLFGYAFGLHSFSESPGRTTMPFQTSAAMCILSIACLCATSDRGIGSVLANSWPSGTLLRRMLPVSLLAPLLLGWMALVGLRGGYFGPGVAGAFISTGSALLIVAFLVWTVLSLRRSEEQLQFAAQDLAASEQMFRTSFENAFVGMAYLDSSRSWTRVNSRFCDLLGFAPAAILGRPLDEVVHSEHGAEMEERLRALQAGRTELYKGVERWRHREGRSLWFDFRVTALRSPEGEFRHFIFVLQDVTEARLAAEQLRIHARSLEAASTEREALLRTALEDRSRAVEAARARDVLLAVVSHELRSPLNSIRLWASLLQSDARPDAEMIQRALQHIEAGVEAQSRLVNDLLDASRIASGKLELELERIDLCAVASEVVAQYRLQGEKHGVRLDVDCAEERVVVNGDRGRLKQALCNLVENAIKFTPAGGRVDVVLGADGSEVDLHVRDTGLGIGADNLPRIFDPFWQAQGGASSGHGGLGLGLHIVKHVVERHGGNVSVRSDGAGRGSTFSLRLPLVGRTTPDPVSTEGGIPFASTGTDGDVLVVDDEPGTAEALALALRARGQEVRVALDGESALAAIANRRPRVVVSDLMMPGIDGCELLRRVREQEQDGKTFRVRAIAITGRGSPSDRWRVRRAGFDACLTKPVRIQELFEWIQDAFTGSPSVGRGQLDVLVLGATDELSAHLREAGHRVVSVGRLGELSTADAELHPDFLLVDLDAVRGDARHEVRELRENRLSLFVVGLTESRMEGVDREMFDAVLEKPLRLEELARVLRRAQETQGG